MAEDQQRVVIISLAFIRIQAIGSVNDLVQCFENGSFEKCTLITEMPHCKKFLKSKLGRIKIQYSFVQSL